MKSLFLDISVISAFGSVILLLLKSVISSSIFVFYICNSVLFLEYVISSSIFVILSLLKSVISSSVIT
jgi:hypothetical protein